MTEIVYSDNFRKRTKKLDNSQALQLAKLIEKIKNHPEIGKPMRNLRKGTREIYAGSYRLSYIFDGTVMLVDCYHKDGQ